MKYQNEKQLYIDGRTRAIYNNRNSKLFRDREIELEKAIGASKNFIKDKYPHSGKYYEINKFYRTDQGYLNIKPQYRRGYNATKL